jgi:hypothetical protein
MNDYADFDVLEARLTFSAAGDTADALADPPVQPHAVVFPMPRKTSDLRTVGRNPYFILEPGHKMEYSGTEEGKHYRLTITVLNRTRRIGGILTRAVRERETINGHPLEVSINYFAIDRRTKHVYYFGEEVNIYKRGRIVSHEGAWLHGVNGAQFGIIMLGNPKVGDQYPQERAPGIAEDAGEVVQTDARLTVPRGTFNNVLRIRESNALEPGEFSFKFYAPGVGLLQDDFLKLFRTSGG